MIETVEETPDTIITLLNGKRYIVKEDRLDITEKIIEYRNKAFSNPIRPIVLDEDE